MPTDHYQVMREEIQKAVKETVNGKIDDLKTQHKLDMVVVREHIKRVEPYLEAASAVKILGNALKWIAGVGLAWVAIKGFFHPSL